MTGLFPGNDDALRAIRLFTTKIADSVAEGRTAYEQSQVADQKAVADQAQMTASNTWTPAPTSSTKSRKATSLKVPKRPAAEVAEPAETTVPPDEGSR